MFPIIISCNSPLIKKKGQVKATSVNLILLSEQSTNIRAISTPPAPAFRTNSFSSSSKVPPVACWHIPWVLLITTGRIYFLPFPEMSLSFCSGKVIAHVPVPIFFIRHGSSIRSGKYQSVLGQFIFYVQAVHSESTKLLLFIWLFSSHVVLVFSSFHFLGFRVLSFASIYLLARTIFSFNIWTSPSITKTAMSSEIPSRNNSLVRKSNNWVKFSIWLNSTCLFNYPLKRAADSFRDSNFLLLFLS